MTRDEFVSRTRELIARGEEIRERPTWDGFRFWLLDSDEFLESVWGRMDRYHLAWLNVGRDTRPPGSQLDAEGERRFMAEVSAAKLAVLRTMLSTVERHGSPALAETADAVDADAGHADAGHAGAGERP